MDVLLAALIPPRRRASFQLGGAVSVSMLRGDSETKCHLEDVVDDGLDDDEPFFLEKRLLVFFHMVAALFSLLKLLLWDVDFECIKVVDFFLSYQAWEGWLCLRRFWAHKLEHTN
jgi:hypothetical protein